jgi:hypothetical protein
MRRGLGPTLRACAVEAASVAINVLCQWFCILPSLGRRKKRRCPPRATAASSSPLVRAVLNTGDPLTPEAGGATSARGVSEYTFNLLLGRRIDQSLPDAGFARTTLMTTRGVG